MKAPGLSASTVPRVTLNPLPVLYVYDHCPFCVRVRLALGLKNVKHEVRFLANDDIPTPTALVGKKVAPIFQVLNEYVMPESLDIIAKVDSDPRFGTPGLFKPMSGREDIKAWQAKVAETNRILQRPRYMMTILPEFQQVDGKNAFVKNHPVPVRVCTLLHAAPLLCAHSSPHPPCCTCFQPFEKDAWKKMPAAEQWKEFEKSYEKSLSLIGELNQSLVELDKLVHCDEYCSPGGLSLDDIDLWSRLRSVSLVKGVVWPKKLGAYMRHFEVTGDVPLYDSMAC